jgi:hypothetical protein
MKTKLEILKETYEYYSDPSKRGISKDGYCEYLTLSGKMCAVGRCLLEPAKTLIENEYFDDDINSCISVGNPELDVHFKLEYRGHTGSMFWKNLQEWHDKYKHFTENGISDEGETAYKLLVEKYCGKKVC